MQTRNLPFVAPLFALGLLATVVVGPPLIKVERVTGATGAPTPGAVLLVEGSHHQYTNLPMVTGRAEGIRDGKRISKAIRLTPTASKERFGVAPQWEAGTAWVLVFTVAESGHSKDFGTAEAYVAISKAGEIVAIEHPKQANARGDKYGRQVTAQEIDGALAALAAR
jgi:hypothetical protein